MGSVVVVVVDEGVDLGLELAQRCWRGLGAEFLLQGLVEAFDLAAGGRVIGPRVLLHDSQADEFGFESVAAAFAA